MFQLRYQFAITASTLCLAVACTDDKSVQQDDVAAVISAAANPTTTEATPVASLSETVPGTLLDMPKVDFSNQSVGSAGFQMSVATAKYGSAARSIQITITDAPAGGPALAAANAWAMGSFERTTPNGYQRTTMVDGYRGYEEFDSRRERATISAFIANRFVFNARGDKVSMQDLRQAVSEFGLRRLGRLADQ